MYEMNFLGIGRGQECHNIIKKCVFVLVGPNNITMECPDLVQGNSCPDHTPKFPSGSSYEFVEFYVQK